MVNLPPKSTRSRFPTSSRTTRGHLTVTMPTRTTISTRATRTWKSQAVIVTIELKALLKLSKIKHSAKVLTSQGLTRSRRQQLQATLLWEWLIRII